MLPSAFFAVLLVIICQFQINLYIYSSWFYKCCQKKRMISESEDDSGILSLVYG